MSTSTKADGAVRGAVAITIAAPGPTFHDVFDQFENEIYRLCTQFAPDRPQADERYRELVARACQTFGDLDRTANLRTWIFNIATSAFLRRHGSGADERTLGPVWSTSPIGTGRDQGRFNGQDTVREVDALVRRLPPKQRAALILRKYHGFGYDEIGKSLNASEADARAMTHSALRTLVDHFGYRM
jgi:RNA polymerase sigma factor (sigma-70 family)